MNAYYPQQYVYYPVTYTPTQYQPQFFQGFITIIVGLMMVVVFFGMIRDLFKGKEVKLPI